jgi:hypothetical protein
VAGWNEAKRESLRAIIAARQPSWISSSAASIPMARNSSSGVSGEPMFNQSCRFVGYRGIGVEVIDGIAA